MNNQDFFDPSETFDDDEDVMPLDISHNKKSPAAETPMIGDGEGEDKPEETKKPHKSRKKAAVSTFDESETTSADKPKKEKKPGDPNGLKTQVISILFWFLAFLTAVFFIANIWENAGPLIVGYATLLYGLFGWGGLFIICLFMLYGLEWKRYIAEGHLLSHVLFSLSFTVLLSALFHVIMIMAGNIPEPEFLDAFRFADHWYTNRTVVGGGVLGGLIGSIFYTLMHGWVSILILLLALVTVALFYLRLTPDKIVQMIGNARQQRAQKKAEAEELKQVAINIEINNNPTPITPETPADTEAKKVTIDSYLTSTPTLAKPTEPTVAPSDPALPTITVFTPPSEKTDDTIDTLKYQFDKIPDECDDDDGLDATDFGYGIDGDDDIDLSGFVTAKTTSDAVGDTTNAKTVPQNGSELLPDEALDELDDLLDEEDDDSLLIGGDAPVAKPKPSYIFPPLDLLKKGPTTEKIDSEVLLKNGQKLVDVLKSFKVDTEIVNIACGPTVTRYELAPKSGVRVRAIANLVDDIALNLETSGVRIEAPIPGKAAVGIEVPNKEASIVYLRDLIESEAFQNAKSKLTACVGMDVSGAPILMDIAKMPHLLIAGATGMGKSVGVNSIIMSLLYKATPDELKLILVDPKKVELNMYNNLPHLLIPVVNNPKKAAGALATAVNEMERRFELIESVGARNIKGYNKLVENDPTKEQLPSIVIIIDELADLMMTAKDDVEDSICRIAQKARAAGIHLIICTQRPSVDVITGLIKANVPSRIAFTVASNIDSRTIIDIAGAEKLIGRGDMLFAPVGAMKPMRVQGSFVDDPEVEAVTDFIKQQSKNVQYDDSFLSQVEIEAERCGQQKKKVAADEIDADDDLDPKFYEAVELAVEMGKISTSLLQRKLSLGYGRAAKIIDSMEAMGIVGAPDGQKPRNCLITRQEYQEMMMRNDPPES